VLGLLELDEEDVELGRGSADGYRRGAGTKVSALQGITVAEALRDLLNREDLLTGMSERRMDTGFVFDGQTAANAALWQNKLWSEYFTIVSC